jgi:hypothetical protein
MLIMRCWKGTFRRCCNHNLCRAGRDD